MGFFKVAGSRLYSAGLALLGRRIDPEGWYSASGGFEIGDGPVEYRDLVKWGYYNAWGRACINLLANGVSSLPWTVRGREDKVKDKSPLMAILGQPSEDIGSLPIIKSVMQHLLIGGEAYLLQKGPGEESPNRGKPTRLWVFPAYEVAVTPNAKSYGDILGFKRGTETYAPEEMTQIKLFNPMSPIGGVSPIEADFYAFMANTIIMKWYAGLLVNGARPSAQLIGQSPGGPSQTAKKAAEEYVRALMAGAENAGKVTAPPPGFEVKAMGLGPMDLGLTEMEESSRLRIFAANGVPPETVGDHKYATYSNYEEAGQRLYQDTIIPYAVTIAAVLNKWLAPRFGEDRLTIDMANIPALQEDKDALAERFSKYVKSSIMTPNEAREGLGLDLVGAEGDELLTDMRTVPLKQVAGEPQIGTVAPKGGTE